MKILTALQIKELDTFTIQQQSISEVELMERAAKTCFEWIIQKFNNATEFIVVCGQGNNGGDGLVLARLLTEKKFKVHCVVIRSTTKATSCHAINLKRLENIHCPTTEIKNETELDSLHFSNKVVIDSIFGLGLSRPAVGLYGKIIQKINQSNTKSVLSIDVPSGMYCDQLNTKTDTIITADYTLTFHSPKQSFFFPEAGNHTGKVLLMDIELEKEHAEKLQGKNYFLSQAIASQLIKKRKIFTHKGSYGHANIVAGSHGKMGAAVLSAKGASYAGAGLVTATIPTSGLNIMQTSLPTVMCDIHYGDKVLNGEIEIDDKYTYGIGPGIGKSGSVIAFIYAFLEQVKSPIVIDADALNIISEHQELLRDLPENSILTPHIKEFERLVGKIENSDERLKKLISFSTRHKIYVVLKDARTIICSSKGECFFSLSGSPGMATGGSGDVLTGILTGLLAQGYTPEHACKIGVILHGTAGELASEKYSENAMTAESVLDQIGNAFKLLTI